MRRQDVRRAAHLCRAGPLAAQQIFFPKAGSDSLEDPAVKPYLSQYAGQQLVTGAQAEAYANHFIAVHINAMAGGKTYSQLSQGSLANPNDAKLAGQVQTVFRGETLRGLLLNAYAFGKMGQIALIAAIASFTGAGLRRGRADAETDQHGASHRLTQANGTAGLPGPAVQSCPRTGEVCRRW